ncbi:MAG: hypothetical protein A2284_18065 [Deltaproteobacteria bacterium RIFOXYA12_FULL_61_11]|nr:MAG: hypothetical protein A2284_18065 [Deltaproteobacteria bacterium RIFOXYA12_FULL_61_11]
MEQTPRRKGRAVLVHYLLEGREFRTLARNLDPKGFSFYCGRSLWKNPGLRFYLQCGEQVSPWLDGRIVAIDQTLADGNLTFATHVQVSGSTDDFSQLLAVLCGSGALDTGTRVLPPITKEQRRYPRVSCRMPAILYHNGQTWAAEVRDFSAFGIFVVSDLLVSKGHLLEVVVTLPSASTPRLAGEVRRILAVEEVGRRRVGLGLTITINDNEFLSYYQHQVPPREGAERRRHRRLKVSLPLRLFLSSGEYEGTTHDLAPFGLYFFTTAPLHGLDELEFSLVLPTGETEHLKGSIIRVEQGVRDGSACFGVALQIMINDEGFLAYISTREGLTTPRGSTVPRS